MTAPPREPQSIYDALSTIYDWLCDDRLTQWPYMENGPFYSDLPKYQEVARVALAAAPAPSAEPPAQAAPDDLVTRLNYGPADGNDTYATETMTLAAERIKQQAREIVELTAEARTANERHHVETERRVRAEAERDTLAAIVRAADEMRAEFGKDMGHWPPAGFTITAYDTARAKVERKE